MIKKITQQQLAKKYGVTQAFVSASILGKRHSRRAKRIRKEYGRHLQDFGESLTNPENRLAA